MSASRFPVVSRFFGTFLLAARLPFVRADSFSDELSNNIIADLAPLLALFGGEVAKQFMSQSMGVVDNIIFAVAPLGIITAMVGAIRVGGPRELKAIIGRARESQSAVEIELMSSTSADVCELWDGKRVVRALGAPPIIELIYLLPDDLEDEMEQSEMLRKWTKDDVGIYDFDSATRQTGETRFLELESPCSSGDTELQSSNYLSDRDDIVLEPLHSRGSRGSQEFESSNRLANRRNRSGELSAPNISLNIGEQTVSDSELCGVAVFGVLLQLAVIVYALLTCFWSPWNLHVNKTGYQKAIYAPLMTCGTVTLVIGMYLCSHIIERSTVEHTWKVKEMAQATVQVAWLQKGGVVNDQVFDSFAIFPALPKRINPIRPAIGNVGDRFRNILTRFRVLSANNRDDRPSIRTSRKSKSADQEILTVIAVFISLCGFVSQFLGLRGLHWSVTVAQLVATCMMTILRAWVQRNLTPDPETHQLERGYELDWMAGRIKRCENWSVVNFGIDRTLQAQPNALAAATMTARRRLGAISKWPSQWQNTVNSTTKAIEESMNFLFSSADITLEGGYWAARDLFEWKMVVEVGTKESGNHLEEITLTLKRTRLLDGPWGAWRVVKSEVEAVIGLWMQNISKISSMDYTAESDWQSDEACLARGRPILRILGPYDGLERMGYQHWIGRQTGYLKVDDLEGFTQGETKKCDLVIGSISATCKDSRFRAHAGNGHGTHTDAPVLGVITTTVLERICGQVIFSEFISSVSKHATIGGKVNLRGGNRGIKTSFGLSCDSLTRLVEIVERAGLADTEEAYMTIVPALNRSGKLPIDPNNTHLLFADIVKATNSHISNGRPEQAGWFLLWLFHFAETAVDVCMDRRDWRRAGEVYCHLRRQCEALLDPKDAIAEVNTRIALFCEGVFASIAVGGLGRPDRFSDTLELVSSCMAEALGPISKTTLDCWKAKNRDYGVGGRRERRLLEAATEGRGFLVEIFLQDGANIEYRDTDLRTPLILACIYGHAAVVGRLIRMGADVNAKDFRGQTALHYASQRGFASVVRILLLCDDLLINACDILGCSSLELADQENARPVVSLLRFYGADELGTGATRCLHTSFIHSSDAWIKLTCVDGETPLHHVVSSGNKAAVEILLKWGANTEVKDDKARTPLHFAARLGHTEIAQLLLEKHADPKATDFRKWTPLHTAARRGHLATVQLLITRGVNTEPKDIKDQTPLHWASYGGHLATVELLLDKGVCKEAMNEDKWTPLYFAARHGRSETVELLLDLGAKMEARDNKDWTPLHSAASHGHTATVQLLLQRGANKEARDSKESTPLHRAASSGQSTIVQLLIDSGVNKEAKDNERRTPLHCAAGNGHSETVQLLLERGANREALDSSGHTPFQVPGSFTSA